MTSAPPVLAPLEGSARLWGTFALSAATFMNILDSSIANVSLPAIAGDHACSSRQLLDTALKSDWILGVADVARARRQEDTAIPDGFDYAGVRGLSSEVREKLARVRPDTVGQAGRIPGVTPAAVSLLLVHLKRARATG